MRKPLFLIAAVALLAALAACTRPVLGPEITVTATSQTTPVPDASPASGLSPEEQAVADASSPDELNSLISIYVLNKNYPMALRAADRLLELDPADDAAYATKTELLILALKDAYDALNGALAEDIGKVSDPAGYRARVRQLYDEAGLELVVPFIPDYTSGDEINSVGATAGNLSACCFIGQDFSTRQSGVLAWQGDWVYFSEYGENFALYKMRLDGSDRQLVCADGAASLNVVGDWIYFSNVGDNNRLYKVRTDGSLLTKLADDRCGSLCVSGDRIYYINADDGDTIYRIGTDGSERAPFFKQASTLFIDGDWLYFSSPDEKNLMRIRLDGTDDQLLLGDVWNVHIRIQDGWLYYMTDSNGLTIMRMPPDASEKAEEVWRYDAKINFFTFAGGRLIVAVRDPSDTETVLVFDPDTMEQLMRVDIVTDAVGTAGDNVYFMNAADDMSWHKLNWVTGTAEKAW